MQLKRNFILLALPVFAVFLAAPQCPSTPAGLVPTEIATADQSDDRTYYSNGTSYVRWNTPENTTLQSTELTIFTGSGCKTGNETSFRASASLPARWLRIEGITPEGIYSVGLAFLFKDGQRGATACMSKSLLVDKTPPSAVAGVLLNGTAPVGEPLGLADGVLTITATGATENARLSHYRMVLFTDEGCRSQATYEDASAENFEQGFQIRLPMGQFYFGIKAADLAGNWGPFTCFSRKIISAGPNTQNCLALRQDQADPQKAIRLVFIPSGYSGTAGLARFKADVQIILEGIKKHKPFADSVKVINAYYVNQTTTPVDFCQKDGDMISCDYDRVSFLESTCGFDSSEQIVVWNNPTTIGRANAGGNLIFMSNSPINGLPAAVAAHEMGHSVFGLGDEYLEGNREHASWAPNCDWGKDHEGYTENCQKWADLRHDASFSDVQCFRPSCGSGANFAPHSNSMMRITGSPFYSVNERIACCAYREELGVLPPTLCDRFTDAGMGLQAYCDQADLDLKKQGLRTYLAHPKVLQLSKNPKGEWELVREVRTSSRTFASLLTEGQKLNPQKAKNELIKIEVESYDIRGVRKTQEMTFSTLESREAFALNQPIRRQTTERKHLKLVVDDPQDQGQGRKSKSPRRLSVRINGQSIY